MLDNVKIGDSAIALPSNRCIQLELIDKIHIESTYFENNSERIRYPNFSGQHLLVGAGVIEAGRKTPIGSRYKQVRHAVRTQACSGQYAA